VTPPSVSSFRLWTHEERQASLQQALAHWQPGQDVWIYAYGSLIWRPDFEFAERRLATLRGYHRSLCLWSQVNRGTPECPGLVFGLDRGGSCRGVVYRLPGAVVESVFTTLWQREMPTGAYLPRWLHCETEAGRVPALAFVMNRANYAYAGALTEDEILAIVRRAEGSYGPCTEYVTATASALRQVGIRDRRLEAIAHRLTYIVADGGTVQKETASG